MKHKLRITLFAAVAIVVSAMFCTTHTGGQVIAAEQYPDSLAADTLALDSLPYEERLKLRLDDLCAAELFASSQLGLMVYDLDDNRILYATGEKQVLRPASTMKLLTAVCALDILGSRYRFRTDLLCDGDIAANVLNGNLYIRGTMDPALDETDIERFADGVRSLYIDTIRGKIIADRSFIDAPPLGRGWSWDDDNPAITPLVYKKGDNLSDVLRRKIVSEGIVVEGRNSSGTTPDSATVIASRYTTIETVLMHMLKESDNLYAESVFYNIAAATTLPATADEAIASETAFLRRLGLNPDNYGIADGSGLSPYNYLSAEAEIYLLRYAYNDFLIFPALYRSLPVAGQDGTLRWRMNGGKAQGNVRAKTGTLTGVSTLAGYCTSPEGHTLAFAVFNQGMMNRSRAHAFQNAVCEALCD
ncbi:MAG: D-alanyl-D-alanine carboxypeptidase/D-alanyl-D-alanine-endopeptidase [Prevotella sp.]|nr:D-alanyl-D-alanine carboxypeptidase/D-alanyl-D-alanine-endopeptidase [Prevotella sp.]